MPPTRHRQWCIRPTTRDAGSTARGRASKDQVVGSANRRGHQGVGTRPEGYQCHPSRDLLKGSGNLCTILGQLTPSPARRNVLLTQREVRPVVAPATGSFHPPTNERSARCS